MSTAMKRGLGVLGLVLFVAVGYFYLTAGLVVSGIALIILWFVWLAGAFLAFRVFRDKPELTLLVALGAAVFWFLYLSLGERLFGWTP